MREGGRVDQMQLIHSMSLQRKKNAHSHAHSLTYILAYLWTTASNFVEKEKVGVVEREEREEGGVKKKKRKLT